MKIKTQKHYSEEWTAIDEESYDGSESPMGSGNTEDEAIEDLKGKFDDRKPQVTRRMQITTPNWRTDGCQVWPDKDLREHQLDSTCWCNAFLDDGILIHNAMDKREQYECGERKFS